MLSTITIVLPIFALVFVGWVVRRLGILTTDATVQLNRYVVSMALPALLFRIIVHARWHDIWQPKFIAAFGVGCVVLYLAGAAGSLLAKKGGANAAIDGLNSSLANTSFMGFPIALAALGPKSQPLVLISAILTTSVMFGIALVQIELSLQAGGRAGGLPRKLTVALIRNPLIASPLLGAVVATLPVSVPGWIDTFLMLLSASAAPCALVTIGLFVAEQSGRLGRDLVGAALLSVGKLLIQPLVTWLIAVALAAPPLVIHAATLLSALPTGITPFILAQLYRKDEGVTSSTILLSTTLSIVTVTGYLALIK